MTTIREGVPSDAPKLPAVEQSAGEAFRKVANVSWIAHDGVQSVETRQCQLCNVADAPNLPLFAEMYPKRKAPVIRAGDAGRRRISLASWGNGAAKDAWLTFGQPGRWRCHLQTKS